VFENDDALASLTAHITQEPPPLRPLVPGSLPDELEQLIGRCLAKQPAQRPASARELGQLLRRIRFDSSEEWSADLGQVWWRERVVVVKERTIETMQTVLSTEGAPRLRPWEP
jgi:serine/threonine protein kinase